MLILAQTTIMIEGEDVGGYHTASRRELSPGKFAQSVSFAADGDDVSRIQ